MANGQAIADAARLLVGTPYHHQGRKAGVGLDCIGVPILAARAAGLDVHDFAAYGPMPVPEVLLDEIAKDCDKVEPSDMRTGDILCFKSGFTHPSHFGVLLGDMPERKFVHAYNKLDRVNVQILDDRWLRLLHSVWRVKGVR